MDYQIDKCNRTLKAIKDEECPFERILNLIRCNNPVKVGPSGREQLLVDIEILVAL